MRSRARWLVSVALLAFTFGCGLPDAEAAPTEATVATLFPLQADSARFVLSWTSPAVGFRQLPIGSYETRVTLAGEEVYSRSGIPHPQVADTFAVPWPGEIGDSEGPYRAHVRALDTDEGVSEWISTSEWDVTATPLPPSPPGDVEVDSIPAVMATSVMILPDSFAMKVGDTFQLCAYVEMSDGSWLMQPDSPECEGRLVETFGSASLPWNYAPENPLPTGAVVRVRYWPRVVAVSPGHEPLICGARLYATGRLDYSPGCLDEARRWAGLEETRVPAMRFAQAGS